ncbi:hypothetical protein AMECASPLE_026139 [Ameca splendens]|uniref:Uncharacterized protein n=1 Tax=Ameca splendens TaxID=208324 RepID=A0ABV0YFZ5_9TELE
MGKKQSKLINLEGDVKFMENYVEGAGMICHRWNKKHGFLGKLNIKDILKLQGDLKLEIIKTKKPTKKEQRKVEYKLSDKWLEQSKLRHIQRQDKKEKRKEKLTAAVLVRPHEDSGRIQTESAAPCRAGSRPGGCSTANWRRDRRSCGSS